MIQTTNFIKTIPMVVKSKSIVKPCFIRIYVKTGNKIEFKFSRELRWL
jgi:hypothetical protein